MKRCLGTVALAALLLALTGCGGDGEKGDLKDKDRPRHAAPEKPADGDKK